MNKAIEYLDMLCDEATEGPWEFYAHDGSMASLSTVGKPLESVVFSTVRCESCQHRQFRCSWPKKADANFMEAFNPKRAKALMKLAQAAISLVNSGYAGPFKGEDVADLFLAAEEAESELESVEIKPMQDAFCPHCKGVGWYIEDEQRHTCYECSGSVLISEDPKPVEYCGDCDGVGWMEGGETLQTTCSRCEGSGVVPA